MVNNNKKEWDAYTTVKMPISWDITKGGGGAIGVFLTHDY
jgi:hypothetical protein